MAININHWSNHFILYDAETDTISDRRTMARGEAKRLNRALRNPNVEPNGPSTQIWVLALVPAHLQLTETA